MIVEASHRRTVIMVDDDEDDFFLMKSAFKESALPFPYQVSFLSNGQVLLDYLRRNGEYSDPSVSPRPCLILLDLNMPLKDGREVLKEISADPALNEIPVVVLTTSSSEEDKALTRELGAIAFVTKPSSFAELVDLLKTHRDEWFGDC